MSDDLLAIQLPCLLELTDNQRIGILEKHTVIIANLGSKPSVPRHRLQHRQIVFLCNLIVISAKSRCNMHNTGAVLS